MKIGNYNVDDVLFKMYIRSIIAIATHPFESLYDDRRWQLHCRILESVELEHRFKVYRNTTPTKLETPSRTSSSLPPPVHLKSAPDKQDVMDFNLALKKEVELFLKDY